ncbi:NAD(P)/FAD-dependent oxidoreductase [Halomarina litorea]|uniref:NAD(P)/FAD-dependent oxidoreductase n=1 Tax=Halomarina litorea TaxID=2961595 RepID=UPI0020C47553|nr:FAD-dependent oxidoreductase [Halomarina sp. BCD28]
MRVGVVGGGAFGVTLARDLAARDCEVVLFERGDLAAGSSGRAAGVCYDAFADRPDAEVGRRALDRFREFSGTGGFEFTDCPYVFLAREGDDRRARAIEEGARRMADHALDVRLVSPADLGERFPDLRTDDVAVAAVAEGAGYTDPAAYTRMMGAEARRTGADLRTHTPVELAGDTTVETDAGRESFDRVVVAAGAHTRRVLAAVDVPVPVKPYRVQALTTGPVAESDPLPMLYDATGGYYLRPREGGLLVGDGTEPIERNPDDWDRAADDWFVADCAGYLETALGRSVPVERAWAGLCTATPDGHPLLGECAPGLYVAAGWQGHGFMRAPALAERLAELILGGAGIDHFAPDRFAGDEAFDIVEGMAIE